jgi:hypothetical protein
LAEVDNVELASILFDASCGSELRPTTSAAIDASEGGSPRVLCDMAAFLGDC